MDLARAKMKKRKDAREVAKEEEKNWVEFRKLQVLYDCRPKSRAYSRREDDSFPRRRRGVSMGFGERKAYFLAIRPNPRYATWFGKRKNWATKEKDKKRSMETAQPEVFCVPVQVDERDLAETVMEIEDENPGERKGNHAVNPLVRGLPFWIIPEEEEEPQEDDLPIDRELIEKVLDGTFNIVSNSLARDKFDPYSEVNSYKKLDKFFTRDLIIGDTVKTVINLMEEPNDNAAEKMKELDRVVTWNTKMMVTSFESSKRDEAIGNVRLTPLKDVIRVATPACN
ncbi:unnamed protein product [Heligmosomoides polygyrus]|uniref:Zinc finger, CCHC-type n=1 Tax=Heligmosomoides polygyrus TaxID=6339 RepID=A0A3P8AFK3_HELPZ|nr:unnamed protein product [Heligmosomoides polygyrus]